MFAAVPWPQVRISRCISVGSLQDVESQAASVTFQLPRGHNAKSPKPEDWRAQALTCEVISSAEQEQPGHQPIDWTLLQPTQSSQLNSLSSRSSPLKTEKMDGEQGLQPKDWCCAGTRQDSKYIGLFRIGQSRISVHSVDLGSLLDMDQFNCVSIATLLGKEARYIHDTPVCSVHAKNYRVVDATIVTQRQDPMIREVQRTFEIPVY